MTHPIVEAVAARIADDILFDPAVTTLHRDHARWIVAEVLRLAREPSERLTNAMHAGLCPLEVDGMPCYERCAREWRAGIDALLREVEG